MKTFLQKDTLLLMLILLLSVSAVLGAELDIRGSVQHWVWHTPVNGWESGIHLITFPTLKDAPFSAWIFAEDMRLYDTRSWSNTNISVAHWVLNLSSKWKLKQETLYFKTDIGYPVPLSYSPYTADLSDGRSVETGVTTSGLNVMIDLPTAKSGFAILPFRTGETGFATFYETNISQIDLKFSVADFFAATYFNEEQILGGKYNDFTYAVEGKGRFENGIIYSFDYAKQNTNFLADTNRKFKTNKSAKKLEFANIIIPGSSTRMNLTLWDFEPGFAPRMHNRSSDGPLYALKEKTGMGLVLSDQQGRGSLQYKNYVQAGDVSFQDWELADKRNIKGFEILTKYDLVNQKVDNKSGTAIKQSDLIQTIITKPFSFGELKIKLGKQRGQTQYESDVWVSGFDEAYRDLFFINQIDLGIKIPEAMWQSSTLDLSYAHKLDLNKNVFAKKLVLSLTHYTASNSSISLIYRKSNPSNNDYSTGRPVLALRWLDNCFYFSYQRNY